MLVIGYTAFLFYELKWIGILVPLLLVGLASVQSYLSRTMFKHYGTKKQLGDKRGKLLDEILQGIKMIKFEAWENLVAKKLDKLRLEEKNASFFIFLFGGLSETVSSVIPLIVALISFWLYSSIYGKISTAQVYSLLTLYYNLVQPLRLIMFSVSFYLQTLVASKRFQKLAKLKKQDPLKDDEELEKGAIVIENASVSWENPEIKKIYEEDSPREVDIALENLNLKIDSGEFVAVIGKVGSGKTSLLMTMMNELVTIKGKVRKSGRMALIPQEAFLINETVKNNIIFGEEENKKKFKEVVKVCELRHDLNILAGREFTQIGERGLNLSGGQKQRISLGRAVYSESDIYIIDDALSALDAEVGKKIMKNVFCKQLKDKTRVLVTHKLDLLEAVDRVIIMKNGKIAFNGDYEAAKRTQEFRDLSEEVVEHGVEDRIIDQDSSFVYEDECYGSEEYEESEGTQLSIPSLLSKEKSFLRHKGQITKGESKKKGLVNLQVYLFYIKSCGLWKFFFLLLIYISVILLKTYSDVWVSYWMNDTLQFKNQSHYPLIFLGLLLASCLVLVIRSLFFSFTLTNGGYKLFKDMLLNILRRPISFFDTVPSGQILNRAVHDITAADSSIPFQLNFLLSNIFILIGILGVTISVSPPLLLIAIGFGVMVKQSFEKFLGVSVELERMMKLADSPMITSVSEIVKGAESIRVYNKLDYLMKLFKKRFNCYTSCHFHCRLSSPYLRVRVDMAALMLIFLAIVWVSISKNLKYFFIF